jgi:hypothetical protein
MGYAFIRHGLARRFDLVEGFSRKRFGWTTVFFRC